jgi:N-methylhydantoinase B
MFGDAWAKGTGSGVDEGRGDGCDSGANQLTIESCISDVEMNELMYPFLYLWRREGVDTAAPGRWRGGASVNWAVVPHNSSSTTIAFVGTGKYADRGQSLDGAYPPSLGDEGEAAIFRLKNLRQAFARGEKPDNIEDFHHHIREKGGEWKRVDLFQPSQPVTEDDVILNICGGGAGVGDPLDREPERVLADVRNRIFSLKMAKDVFGVIIDSETLTLDKKGTETERGKIKARRKERGKPWKKNN